MFLNAYLFIDVVCVFGEHPEVVREQSSNVCTVPVKQFDCVAVTV